jgi:NADH-quinone oxidoreductase subunit H
MLATTMFLGGWRAPWPIAFWDGSNRGYWPVLWFLGKVLAFVFVFIWLRGTLPRLRYDQFMRFGWKVLIPASLVWIIAVSTIRAINLEHNVNRSYLLVGGAIALMVFLALLFIPESSQASAAEAAERDLVGTGYPVPPMPTADQTVITKALSDRGEQESIRG